MLRAAAHQTSQAACCSPQAGSGAPRRGGLEISTKKRTHARTGPDTQRAQAHSHTQNSNSAGADRGVGSGSVRARRADVRVRLCAFVGRVGCEGCL